MNANGSVWHRSDSKTTPGLSKQSLVTITVDIFVYVLLYKLRSHQILLCAALYPTWKNDAPLRCAQIESVPRSQIWRIEKPPHTDIRKCAPGFNRLFQSWEKLIEFVTFRDEFTNSLNLSWFFKWVSFSWPGKNESMVVCNKWVEVWVYCLGNKWIWIRVSWLAKNKSSFNLSSLR